MSIDFNKQKEPKPVRSENYWRYQKKVAPVDENLELNGPVITRTLPNHFKCSKCEFVDENGKAVQSHYFEDHA